MPQAFYEIASTAAENIQIPRMGIVLEILLDLQRQGVHAAPHVGRPGRQPDTNTARNRDHRRARTASTRASAEPSTSRSTITREPSASAISIRPAAGASLVTASAKGGRAPEGSTTTGMVADAVEQRAGEALVDEDRRPFLEGQV